MSENPIGRQIGNIIGVESAENGTYRGAIYHPISRKLLRIADERESYGDAFARAHRMDNGEA